MAKVAIQEIEPDWPQAERKFRVFADDIHGALNAQGIPQCGERLYPPPSKDEKTVTSRLATTQGGGWFEVYAVHHPVF